MTDFEGMAEIAEYNLRRFVGDKADRDLATRAFPFWEGYEYITMATRNKVLATFPESAEREPVAGVDCLPEPAQWSDFQPSGLVVGSEPILKAVG